MHKQGDGYFSHVHMMDVEAQPLTFQTQCPRFLRTNEAFHQANVLCVCVCVFSRLKNNKILKHYKGI
jgi:hypothetical protein